jgi:energy-coupling factor transporter ATP-binding protein EcfA2
MSYHITKELIFETVDSLAIIQKAIDLPESFRTSTKFKNISSPFTNDSKPSFSVYQKNGEWKWKDFSSSEGGNCFDLWAKTKMKSSDGANFYEVLKDVATSFNIQVPTNDNNFTPDPKQKWGGSYMPFSTAAVEFWQQAGVTVKVLDNYKVRQLLELEYYSDAKQKFNKWNFSKEISFEYRISEMRKLYRPSQTLANDEKRDKIFMQRGEEIGSRWLFGFDQLPAYKVSKIIITAGEKDCIAFNANDHHSVCFASEGTMPSIAQMKMIKRKCHTLCVMFDNDKNGAGQKFAAKLASRYDLLNLTFKDLEGNQNDAFDYFKNVKDGNEILNLHILEELKTFNKLRGLSVWEFDGSYCKYNKTEKKQEWISNFTIETEGYIEGSEDGTPAKRIFTLVKKGVKSKSFQAPAEVFLSGDKFANHIQNYVGGNYIFKGSTNDLKDIQVLANMGLDQTAKSVLLGQSETESGDWIFSNGVLSDGKFIKPDRNRIAKNYYLDQSLDINFAYKNGSKWTLQNWFDSISKMYGSENTFSGLAFVINSLIYDNIAVSTETRKIGIHPILSLYGQKGSGKSYLAKCLLSLFAYEYQPLEKSTAKALAASTRAMRNIPLIKDEVNHLTDYDIDIFKGIANLTGFSKKAFSNDDRVIMNPPLRPLITCGQILFSDESMQSRSFLCECKVLKKSNTFMKVSREFSTEKEKGFSGILGDLLQYRHAMIHQFTDTMFELMDSINEILDDANENDINTRIVTNMAVLFTPILIAQRNGLKINIDSLKDKHAFNHMREKSDFEKTLLGFIYTNLEAQKEMEQASDPVEKFLSALPEMEREGRGRKTYIQRGYDYDFDDNEVWIRPSAFKAYIVYAADNNEKLFERANDIQNYLKKKEYFVGYTNKTMRMLNGQARCYVVARKAVNDLGVVFVESTVL